jgi:hypothetical protein
MSTPSPAEDSEPTTDEHPVAQHRERVPDEEWVPDEQLKSLVMERTVHDEESQEDMSRRMLRETAPAAAASIVHLAVYGTTEKMRLDASKYVLERVLGPAGSNVGETNPVRDLLEGLVRDAEAHANQGQ